MKIGNPADKSTLVTPPTGPTSAAETAKVAAHAALTAAAAPVAPDASATLALSSTASTLLSGGSSAEFDAEKVERISQSIAAGTFKVKPDVIADKLIANAHELLSKVQR